MNNGIIPVQQSGQSQNLNLAYWDQNPQDRKQGFRFPSNKICRSSFKFCHWPTECSVSLQSTSTFEFPRCHYFARYSVKFSSIGCFLVLSYLVNLIVAVQWISHCCYQRIYQSCLVAYLMMFSWLAYLAQFF